MDYEHPLAVSELVRGISQQHQHKFLYIRPQPRNQYRLKTLRKTHKSATAHTRAHGFTNTDATTCVILSRSLEAYFAVPCSLVACSLVA